MTTKKTDELKYIEQLEQSKRSNFVVFIHGTLRSLEAQETGDIHKKHVDTHLDSSD